MENVVGYINSNRQKYIEELKNFLSIPSISTLAENKTDMNTAAKFVADKLQLAGMENVKVIETKGHPLVYADWLHAPGKPTVLIYGHYDFTPTDGQRRAIEAPSGPVLVIAGPGAGKTWCLIARVHHLLTERGYLAPELGRTLLGAYVHLRTVEHRLQIVHEFQTHTLPADAVALGQLARRLGIEAPVRQAAREFRARHRAVTRAVNPAFRSFFGGERRVAGGGRLRVPSALSLAATGFRDPERARHNLRLILEGRPLVPRHKHGHVRQPRRLRGRV